MVHTSVEMITVIAPSTGALQLSVGSGQVLNLNPVILPCPDNKNHM